jgi:hypothetical protein
MFREGTIYVNTRTLRRLKWIRMTNPEPAEKLTLDEMADTMLNEMIEAKYPNVLKAEEMFKTSLKDIAEVLKNERQTT